MTDPFNVTLVYGEGYNELIERSRIKNYEIYTKNFDIIDSSRKLKRRIYNFQINNIFYSQTNEYIESLKVVFKDRKKGNLISLLETFEPSNTDQIKSIDFNAFEQIINIKVWVKDKKLAGFEIKTNLNRIIKIGQGEKGQEIIIPELEKEKNIVIGFGVDANKKRVCSIYFYYLDRIRYFDICCPSLLFLRTKILQNKDFIENIKKDKPEIYEKYKLTLQICSLPGPEFFPIASYLC